MNTDHYFMQRCRALANTAAAKGESPVGAVIVKDDKLISEAMEAGKK